MNARSRLIGLLCIMAFGVSALFTTSVYSQMPGENPGSPSNSTTCPTVQQCDAAVCPRSCFPAVNTPTCDEVRERYNQCFPKVTPTHTPTPTPTPTGQRVACTSGQYQLVTGPTETRGGQMCAPGLIMFAVDDGRFAMGACCSVTAGPVTQGEAILHKDGKCGTNEILVGFNSNNSNHSAAEVWCRKLASGFSINYKQCTTSCYYGKGASGRSGSGPCGAPNPLLTSLGKNFGSDGLTAQPGYVPTTKIGKYAGGVHTCQLLGPDGKPVQLL